MTPGRTEASSADLPAPAVLVVDDDAGKRLVIREILAPLGYAVVEADGGPAALGAVLRQTFAVILMDVRMPIMDGYETARIIWGRRESLLTPVIFVTAFGRDEIEVTAAYADGAVDFIFTPIIAEVLQAKVSIFVELFVRSWKLQRSLESITALHAALGETNIALQDSEARVRAVLQNVADGIVTATGGGLIESFNRSAQQLFGYDEDEVTGQPLGLLLAPSQYDDVADPMRSTRSLLRTTDVPAELIETMGCRKDGVCFPMEIEMSQMQVGEQMTIIGCIRDISGRKAYTEALEHRMLHDDLTGLPSRALFADRMNRAIAVADRAGQQCALLVVDLDEFAKVNETLGRDHGDLLLQGVAKRLSGLMRDSDTVSRLGSDEFGIIPSGEIDVGKAAVAAWKVRTAFEQPFIVDGSVVEVRASIGIAFFPQHGRATADLLRRADLAMREAKRAGSGLAVFVAEPEDETARRLTLLNELRDGIPRDELVLHFQPKVELAGPRRTTGVEALVRWLHPTHGLLMPDQFMPEAVGSELMKPLTRWVLDEALGQQRRWCDGGLELTMAVNISARSLDRGSDLPDTVSTLAESWALPPGGLFLELTEDALIDANAPDVLDLLHAMGTCLAIDDFGTGHSSLVYLRRLPIGQIKIDRSFVMNLASLPGDAVIVRSTIDLAHNLGLTVVAEGVEDEVALNMLVEYGCDTAQGYYFSRPCPADELTAWLAESPFGAPARG